MGSVLTNSRQLVYTLLAAHTGDFGLEYHLYDLDPFGDDIEIRSYTNI